MERETGFEPATSTLARSHSTTELFPQWVATKAIKPCSGAHRMVDVETCQACVDSMRIRRVQSTSDVLDLEYSGNTRTISVHGDDRMRCWIIAAMPLLLLGCGASSGVCPEGMDCSLQTGDGGGGGGDTVTDTSDGGGDTVTDTSDAGGCEPKTGECPNVCDAGPAQSGQLCSLDVRCACGLACKVNGAGSFACQAYDEENAGCTGCEGALR